VNTTPKKTSRNDDLARLFALLKRRELASSQEEYAAETVSIKKALDSIEPPPLSTLALRAKARRLPWVQVLEKAIQDIVDDQFHYPFRVGKDGALDVLFVRTKDIMDHYIFRRAQSGVFWEALPIRSSRVLRKHLHGAGLLIVDEKGEPQVFERQWNKKNGARPERVGYLVGINLSDLWQHGLDQLAASQLVLTQGKP